MFSQPTNGSRPLDIVVSTPLELVDNVEIHEPLANSDHNQIDFNIGEMTNGDVDRPEVKRNLRRVFMIA